MSKDPYVAPYNIAVVYAVLGDADAAFAALERAFAERSYLLVEYLNTGERLASLHSEPRFADSHRPTGSPPVRTQNP